MEGLLSHHAFDLTHAFYHFSFEEQVHHGRLQSLVRKRKLITKPLFRHLFSLPFTIIKGIGITGKNEKQLLYYTCWSHNSFITTITFEAHQHVINTHF